MGLLKTGLTAVVAVKTADVIHKRILEHQSEHWGSRGGPQDAGREIPSPALATAQAPETTSQPASTGDPVLDKLSRLAELKIAGVLSDAEFESQKARIIGT